jgi:hypothetical protein
MNSGPSGAERAGLLALEVPVRPAVHRRHPHAVRALDFGDRRRQIVAVDAMAHLVDDRAAGDPHQDAARRAVALEQLRQRQPLVLVDRHQLHAGFRLLAVEVVLQPVGGTGGSCAPGRLPS